jgi:hypothetical protein
VLSSKKAIEANSSDHGSVIGAQRQEYELGIFFEFEMRCVKPGWRKPQRLEFLGEIL